jgi:Ca-activated chloride channel family protein
MRKAWTTRNAICAAALFFCMSLTAPASTPAFADSPGGLVAKGNKQYHKKDYGKALELYNKASVKAPESAIVAFNKGDAFYKKGDLEKAREQFQQAASKTKSLPFEAKAWYNLGNCAFKAGGREEDSDLQKALQSYEESVKFYGTALEKDPNLKPAAQNMEIARLKIKDLLDKIKNQQQQGGKQNQQNQNQQGQQNQQQQQQQGQQQQQEGQDKEQQQQQNKDQQQGAEQNKDQEQKQQADKNKQGAPKDQQKKQLARDATAREILDQEEQDRKDQQFQNAGGYRPVEKDW